MGLFNKPLTIPNPATAPPGCKELMVMPAVHFVNGNPLQSPFPENMQQAMFGLGCFWGAEKHFWQQEGVFTTAVGYAGGLTPNPSYEEVCTGMTGHSEVVLVIFNPSIVSYRVLLALFWESHDPTQGMRQGNDIGTQYRSGIYTFTNEQFSQAKASEVIFQAGLKQAGYGNITTEILATPTFYYAEDYHQQYLAKIPNGYCGLGGTGVCYTALSP